MKQLSVTTYAVLRKKIQTTLILGQQKVEEAKVKTYWETGQLINQYLGRTPGERQERHKQVVARLAQDLGFGEKVFYRCMRFAECFPYFSARRNMTWAHYRALIAVPDGEKKRIALADEAATGKWSSRDLEIEIRNLNWDSRVEALDGKSPLLLPVPVLGSFYTYQVIRPEVIHSRVAEPLLDFGFSNTARLSRFTSSKFSAGTVVTSIRNAKGCYTLKETRSQKGTNPESLLYNYKAFVLEVIDGDTLKLEIDTGFDGQHHDTIRLKGIDCPEMNTPKGKAAKRFVEAQLAPCESIILKSIRTRKEKWGRYLGDIFYVDKAGKQVYLNNLLLEKGMAVRVRE